MNQNPVINVYLDDGGDELVVIEQLSDGTKERRVTAEYTTHHKQEAITPRLMRALKSSENVTYIAKLPHNWVRIGWKNNDVRKQAFFKFREQGIDTYEGDVDPVMYYLVESKAKIAKPRICTLDFETDSRVPLNRKKDSRVLTWAVTSMDSGEVFQDCIKEFTHEEERRVLIHLVEVLKSFDVVCVWEGDWKGGQFDTVIFEARTIKCGIPIDPRRWIWLNQLAVWRRMNSAETGAEKESMALENIAQEQLKEGKEKPPDWVLGRFPGAAKAGLGKFAYDLWEADGKFRKLLLQYNARDAVLLRKLELKKGYIALFQTLCDVCGIPPITKNLQPTRQMDGFILRIGREQGRRFASRMFGDDDETPKTKFKGAFVFPPRTVSSNPDTNGEGEWTNEQATEWRKSHNMSNGILKNVHVCDFAGMYPSIMISWNLSSEAKDGWDNGGPRPEGCCISPGTNLITRVDVEGIIPHALKELIRLRKFWSDLAASLPPGTPEWIDAMARSTAYKVAANAFYGAGGSPFSRFYDRDVSESTTQNGVWLIKHVIEQGEKRSMETVMGDTDSNMVIGPSILGFGKFVGWVNEKLIPKLVSDCGCVENTVKLAFEKSFSRLIVTAKKHYIGTYLHYKWHTTCNICKTSKGDPGSVDIRTLVCKNCKHQYTEIPKFLGKPEIKGLEYKRGDKGFLARQLQGQVIDLLVGGLNLNPGVEVPTDELEHYHEVITKMRDYVMNAPLLVEEVQISKSLSKDLKEYGGKKDGTKESIPAHVRVARDLERRGQIIGLGSRIEYVIVDGNVSPQIAIPSEDYANECDRFHLWETVVYEPTKRLLEAAYPEHDWKKWGDVRPPKPRGRGPKVLEGQLGFAQLKTDYEEDLAVPTYSKTPLIVRVPESSGKKTINELKKVFKNHPGARTLELVIVLNSGIEATLKIPLRVSSGSKLKEDVERVLAEGAAS